MTTNPFYNACLAVAYIVGIVLLVFFAPKVVAVPEQSIFIPMGMLSLLVLSVSVMAYLFFYQPIVLLLDGQRERAAKLFLQTIGIFACATAAVFLISVILST